MIPEYYHFTCRALSSRIQREGITRGMIPWGIDARTGGVICRRGFQWLTVNPSWDQEWCRRGMLPYARNAVRLTVVLPGARNDHVAKWSEICLRYNPPSAPDLNSWGDPDNWRLYAGPIHPSWIVNVEYNPGLVILPDATLQNGGLLG